MSIITIPATETEEMTRLVSQEASRQNGWNVEGIDLVNSHSGIVRFHRPRADTIPGHGTAFFDVSGDSVAFDWGHYDLDARGSRKDFAARVIAGR